MERFIENVDDLLSKEDLERKAQGIPTTFEMDGLTTREDILNRHRVMMKCGGCDKWQEQDIREKRKVPCENCKSSAFEIRSATSLRSWQPSVKKKRGKRNTYLESEEPSSSGGKLSWNDPRFVKSKYVGGRK